MKKIGIFLMMVVSIMSLRESELLKKATQADRYLYVQSEIDQEDDLVYCASNNNVITLTYENDLTVKVFQIDADDDDYSVINKKITKIDSTQELEKTRPGEFSKGLIIPPHVSSSRNGPFASLPVKSIFFSPKRNQAQKFQKDLSRYMAQKAYRESKNFIGLPFNRVPFESFPRLVQKPIAPGLTSQVVEKLLAQFCPSFKGGKVTNMKQVGNLLVIDFTNSAGVSLKVNSLMNHYKHTLEIISTTRENKGSPLHSQPPKSKPAIPKETTLLEDLTALQKSLKELDDLEALVLEEQNKQLEEKTKPDPLSYFLHKNPTQESLRKANDLGSMNEEEETEDDEIGSLQSLEDDNEDLANYKQQLLSQEKKRFEEKEKVMLQLWKDQQHSLTSAYRPILQIENIAKPVSQSVLIGDSVPVAVGIQLAPASSMSPAPSEISEDPTGHAGAKAIEIPI